MSDKEKLEHGLVTTIDPKLKYLMLEDGTKICRSCQQRKPAKFFSNNRWTKDGKQSKCKDCASTWDKKWYSSGRGKKVRSDYRIAKLAEKAKKKVDTPAVFW